jgi:hypothetical protein
VYCQEAPSTAALFKNRPIERVVVVFRGRNISIDPKMLPQINFHDVVSSLDQTGKIAFVMLKPANGKDVVIRCTETGKVSMFHN